VKAALKQVGAQELCFLQWIISRSTTSFDKVRIIYQANEPKYDGKSNSKPNTPSCLKQVLLAFMKVKSSTRLMVPHETGQATAS